MKKSALFITSLLFYSLGLVAQVKGDPWIKKYYNETYRREPTALEYNINNYNNGSWNNYPELAKYIAEYQKNIAAANLTFKFSTKVVDNKVVVGVFQDGTQLAVDLISQDGGKIVAAGGGNVIAAGGANMVAAGGGNMVAAGGGNIAVLPSTKGASLGGAYTVQSGTTKVIKTSGKGAIIIK